MGCKEVDFEVNGRQYRIMEWPPTKTLKLKARLLRQLGAFDFKKLNEFSFDFEKLDPDEFVFFAKELTQDVMSLSEKKKLDFEEYFSEYTEDLYPIIVKVIWIQYSRFFGEKGLSILRARLKSTFQKI